MILPVKLFLCVYLCVLSGISLASQTFSTYQIEDIRISVERECASAHSSDEDKMNCLVSAGNGLLAKVEIAEYKDPHIEALCFRASSGKVTAYLECFESQLSIKRNNPIPQFSTLILTLEDARSYWVGLCRESYGNDVSDCIKKETANFYKVWEFYTNLQSSTDVDKFKSCAGTTRIHAWGKMYNCLIQ